MYPTIYLIILLSVQETPKGPCQLGKCLHVFGTAERRERFYPTALPEILLTGTTYRYLLGCKHNPSPQDRQYTQSGEKQKQEPSSVIHCAAKTVWDFEEISDVFYTQRRPTQVWCFIDTSAQAHILVPGKFPLQTSQSQSLLLKETGFSPTKRHFPCRSHIISSISTYMLLHTHYS